MNVISKTLGTGTVINQTSENVTVDFNGVVKTLIIKFAKLTNEDGSEFGSQFVAEPKKVKKLNHANYMTEKEFSKSKYAHMSKSDYEDMRKADRYNSISW
jgi:hypothetical protein